MTVRRKLLNFGSRSTDFRIGTGALEELPRYVAAAVAKPRRAVLVTEETLSQTHGVTVTRALVDAGFHVDEFAVPAGKRVATLAQATKLYDFLDRCGITSEDLIVALGDVQTCSLAMFCARTWCGETASIIIPTTLDAMVRCPTEMEALDTSSSSEMVWIAPQVSMVVCDLDLVAGKPIDQNGLGYVQIVAAQLAESRKFWEAFADNVPGLVAGESFPLLDSISCAQTSRLNTVKSVSPSSRKALFYGYTTARALRMCLGDDIPWYQLLAEGMRFEARVAHEACDFAIDDVFKQDDYLEDLGIEELTFSLDAPTFIEALKRVRYKRANRFMFSLPKNPGTIRLTVVDDELLERHATAYLASRAE